VGKGPLARSAAREANQRLIDNRFPSEHIPIDIDSLKEVVAAAYELAQKLNKTLPPQKFADLVELLIEDVIDSSDKLISKDKVRRLIEFAS